MKFSAQIKPISYLKANAAKIARELDGQPMVITQNGEARLIVQDVATYEQTQETLALLKMLALGMKQVDEGKTTPATNVFSDIRERHGIK